MGGEPLIAAGENGSLTMTCRSRIRGFRGKPGQPQADCCTAQHEGASRQNCTVRSLDEGSKDYSPQIRQPVHQLASAFCSLSHIYATAGGRIWLP